MGFRHNGYENNTNLIELITEYRIGIEIILLFDNENIKYVFERSFYSIIEFDISQSVVPTDQTVNIESNYIKC